MDFRVTSGSFSDFDAAGFLKLKSDQENYVSGRQAAFVSDLSIRPNWVRMSTVKVVTQGTRAVKWASQIIMDS